ncbi:MAG TPA: 2-hydroxyacid dehydrogenase [Hyphomicrobiaceae bacterium]|nr:2-hydroxyacid dehydrogenase [Hyphomicrobiaceae bacterium]
MAKSALLMTGEMMPLIMQGCDARFEVHRCWEAADRDALLKRVGPQIEAICTGTFTGVKTDEAMMAACPNLKIVANFGVGYDSVDVAAAARRGVIVTNTPEVLTEEVADTALGLLLGTARELSRAEKWLRDGRWAADGDYRLTPASLRDRSVGIAGLGRIGKAIARRVEAFGLPVSYYGRSQQEGVGYRHYSDLVALARDVDTLIVVTPGGPDTHNLIDAAVLNALGPRGILINISRGSVVDEAALIEALKNRTILAAGLDVFQGEPRINPAFLQLDNATLLPHVGSASQYTRNAMGQLVMDNLVAYAEGKPPKTPVPETPFKGW